MSDRATESSEFGISTGTSGEPKQDEGQFRGY
jgi:hypothetical protein